MKLWLVLNSVGLVTVSLAMYLVLRQIGFIIRRISPSGARTSAVGPRIGENITPYFARDLRDSVSHSRKARLLVFGSEACSICATLREGAIELARTWRGVAQTYILYDCTKVPAESTLSLISEGVEFGYDCALRGALGIGFVPFAVVTNCDGVVIGKGAVNEIGHLESLLELYEDVSAGGKNPTQNNEA